MTHDARSIGAYIVGRSDAFSRGLIADGRLTLRLKN
jgi:hypothetical protein